MRHFRLTGFSSCCFTLNNLRFCSWTRHVSVCNLILTSFQFTCNGLRKVINNFCLLFSLIVFFLCYWILYSPRIERMNVINCFCAELHINEADRSIQIATKIFVVYSLADFGCVLCCYFLWLFLRTEIYNVERFFRFCVSSSNMLNEHLQKTIPFNIYTSKNSDACYTC